MLSATAGSSMSSNLVTNKAHQNAIRELKAEFVYMLIPFGFLIGIKGLREGQWESIILAADWSLVACIILGQITARVTTKVASSQVQANQSGLSWYQAKRFALVVICLGVYCFMLVEPGIVLGWSQIVLFLVASWLHFHDGLMVKGMLK